MYLVFPLFCLRCVCVVVISLVLVGLLVYYFEICYIILHEFLYSIFRMG